MAPAARPHERRDGLSYQYVVLRCVPRPDREEFVNVGVVLYCEEAASSTPPGGSTRTGCAALDPRLDLDQVCEALAFVDGVCAGDPSAAARRPSSRSAPGSASSRLRAAPCSSPGPVHGGVTADPARQLEHLLERLVGCVP